jgi:hypothetical protein
MNQTPSAILILASTVLAYAATARQITVPFGPANQPTYAASSSDLMSGILGLSALVLGIWGVISLISACVRDREANFDGATRFDLLDRVIGRPRSYQRPVAPLPGGSFEAGELELSPDLKAQLSMTAHLEGRDRAQIVEEALRRYLPRYERTQAA